MTLNEVKFTSLIFLLAWGVAGCSLLEKWESATPRRAFVTKKEWIVPTSALPLVGFRKINRMKPILTKVRGMDAVIQGNGHDGIAAFSRDSGRTIWHLNVTNGVEASASQIKENLFFGGSDGFFYSVNVNSGQVQWSFPTRVENISEPILHEGNVYFLSGGNTLYALDAATGKQLWLYTKQDPNSLSIRGGSKPAIKGDTIFVGFSDGSVSALFLKSGTVKWEKQLNKNKRFRDLDSDPLVENEFLYLLGYDDAAYCLRSSTGEIVWKSEKGGYGSFVSSKDKLFFPTTNNEFVAVSKETGQRLWMIPVKEGIATTGVFYNGLVVFGESQGDLRFVDSRNGKILNSFNPGRGILASPTVDEEAKRVFFVSGEANLYSLKAGWESQ